MGRAGVGAMVTLISGVGRAEHGEVIQRYEEADERDEQPGCVGSAVHLVRVRVRVRATWLGLGRDEQPGCVGSAVHLVTR